MQMQGVKPDSIIIILEGRVYKVKHDMKQNELSSTTLLKEKPLEQEFLAPGGTIGLELVDDYNRKLSPYSYIALSSDVKSVTLHAMEYKDILIDFQEKQSKPNQDYLKLTYRLFA
jgi:hypothetical protein